MQSSNKHDDDTERRLDEALAESFPASDPPCFVGAGAQPGRHIQSRKKPGDFGQRYGESSYLAIRH
jgi:hypothetical protein